MNPNDKFAYSEEDAASNGESGGLILTADGCMSRHDLPRIEEMSDVRAPLSNAEWNKEQRMWAFAYDILKTKGLKPKNEDLEEFVKHHLELEEV